MAGSHLIHKENRENRETARGVKPAMIRGLLRVDDYRLSVGYNLSTNCQTSGKKFCLLARSGWCLVGVWMSGKGLLTFWPLSEAIWPLWSGWVCHKCLCRLAITGCLCRPGDHWSSGGTESHSTVDERKFVYITTPLRCTHEYQ